MIDSFKKVTGHIISLFVAILNVLRRILKYIPMVQEACKEEMGRDPRFFKYFPNHFKTQEMCNKVLNDRPWQLCDMPDNLKTREMCNKAANIEPWLLMYVPNHLKTQEMCERVVEE